MKKILITVLFVGALIVSSGNLYANPKDYQRIVSLSPSITEMVYAFGFGDKLVGVTRYCRYPPKAKQKKQVGGFLDPNFEVIYGLSPDLVMLQDTESGQVPKFKKMGFDTVLTKTKSIQEILDSIQLVGKTLGAEDKAEAIIKDIESKIANIQNKTKDLKKPTVLITFIRPMGEGHISEVYVAGQDTFFEELIQISGGQNAYQGPKIITSPILSAEGILRLDPDIIIEIMTSLNETKFTKEQLLKDWDDLSELKAYKNKRIHILSQTYISIPGPRISQSIDDIASIIHPE